MSELNWPEATLGSPQLNGYTVPVNSPVVVDTLQGPSRTYRQNHSLKLRLPYSWTSTQLDEFDAWYEQHQAHWFNQTLKFGIDRLPWQVRIYDVTPYKKNGLNWNVTVTVECVNCPLISDDTAELLMQNSGGQITRLMQAIEQTHSLIREPV